MNDEAQEEHELVGGHLTAEVVRVGDTVRRTRGPHSDFVAALLGYLNESGYPHAPRYLGVDEWGRDVLSYVPGVTSDHPNQRTAGATAQGAWMLRELHDLTAGHPLAGGGECVVHGDAGSNNVIFREGAPVALIDWDFAAPGRRIDDLAYLAWSWSIYPVDKVPISVQAEQVRQARDGYGWDWSDALLEAMLGQQEKLITEESAQLNGTAATQDRRKQAQQAIGWASLCQEVLEKHYDVYLATLRH